MDDFALRRGRRYATLLIDAVTHRRIDVLPARKAETLAAWLRQHPQVTVVCRDGSAPYAEAIRDGAPHATQVSDRWHLWADLGKAVEKTVVAHSGCWRSDLTPAGALDERTRERHIAVHTLLDQGVGLLECARRLGWALNTVKRYARFASIWLFRGVLAVAVLAAAALFGLLLARRLTRPVRQLTAMATGLRDGDLAARAPEDGPLEIRTLARTLNNAAQTIEVLLRSQRMLVADAPR